MKRRKWESKTKAMIVIEGLKGRPLSEICTEHQISQAQYYQWREQFLSGAYNVFETKKLSCREAKLEQENHHLKQIIGDLTVELKKNDGVW